MISIGRSRRWIVILGGAWSAKIPLAPPAMSMRMPNPKALLRAVLRMGFVPVFLAALERPLRAQTAYTSYDFTTLAGTEGAVGSSDGTGGNGLIAGFVIGGSTPKAVLIRASGPALIPFGVPALAGGIALIPALIGAFGFAEVLTRLADPVERKLLEMRDSIRPRFGEVARYWRTVLRSGAIGVLTGLMPGVGEDSGAWMSYAAAKATTKEPELFGKGSIDGLMAAETGDMSSIPGHMIPMLALGVPGSAPSAVLMAAIIIHGIQPGPMMMVEHPQFAYDMVAMTTLATVCILIFGLYLVRPLLYVLRVKHSVLMPIIFLMSVVGPYATAWRLFDVYAMLAVGVGAFFLRRKGYQMAPFVLGLVLGNLLDKSLRRGLVLTDGSMVPFFTRPICIAFASVTIFTMLLYVPAFNRAVHRVADAVINPLKSLVARRG